MSTVLRINEIFHSIQTEGPFVGTPATFIRLSGCNLQCAFCDTDHVTVNIEKTWGELYNTVDFQKLVVFTGGEPFLQDFSGLVRKLIIAGHTIQVETNGTIVPSEDWDSFTLCGMHIVVSPKQDVQAELWDYIDSIKLLCNSNTRLSQVKTIQRTCKKFQVELFLQPTMTNDSDETRANILYTVELCKEAEARLSLQYHKLINIP